MREVKSVLILMVSILIMLTILNISSKIVPYNPIRIDLTSRLLPPNAHHLFGTDELGRDIFSRVLVGAANTINVSVMTLFSSFIIGVLIGGIAGINYKRMFDNIFEWIATMSFSLPFILIIASIMSLLKKDLLNAYLVTTAIIWVSPARIVRTGIVKTKNSQFIVAEKSFGMSEGKIFFRSLLPSTFLPAFIFSFKYFPEIVGLEAGLSFLGLVVQPPNPGLLSMIFDSLNYMNSAWWSAFSPAFVLFAIVLIVNMNFRNSYKKEQNIMLRNT